GEETTLAARGRHDPCVLPRAVPIVEAMAALVLCDHALRQRAIAMPRNAFTSCWLDALADRVRFLRGGVASLRSYPRISAWSAPPIDARRRGNRCLRCRLFPRQS